MSGLVCEKIEGEEEKEGRVTGKVGGLGGRQIWGGGKEGYLGRGVCGEEEGGR